MIAAVLPNSNGIYGHMLFGISRVLEAQGYHVLVKLTDNNKYLEDNALDELVNLGVSGILLVTSKTGK